MFLLQNFEEICADAINLVIVGGKCSYERLLKLAKYWNRER